jgi:hypothetical protein
VRALPTRIHCLRPNSPHWVIAAARGPAYFFALRHCFSGVNALSLFPLPFPFHTYVVHPALLLLLVVAASSASVCASSSPL